jgi:hypothetical protein
MGLTDSGKLAKLKPFAEGLPHFFKMSAGDGVECHAQLDRKESGILGVRSPHGGNVLTNAVLKSLPPHDGPPVVCGLGCRLCISHKYDHI